MCDVDARGYLVSIREVLKIEARRRERPRARRGRSLAAICPARRPCRSTSGASRRPSWRRCATGFSRFLEQNAASPKAEYFLLSAVQDLIDSRRARLRVLSGGGPWNGLTYPGDRPRLVAMLEELVARGEYPRELWA